MNKICIRCHKEQEKSEFSKNSGFIDGTNSACKSCLKNEGAVYYANNKDKWKKRDHELRTNDPVGFAEKNRRNQKAYRDRHGKHHDNYKRDWHYKNKFGISLEEYNKMKDSQGDRCMICRSLSTPEGSLHVDHDHKTGKVRGLLCFKCNSGIGFFLDNVDILSSAIAYLSKEPLGFLMKSPISRYYPDEYKWMIKKCEGLCQICKTKFDTNINKNKQCVDHDRITDKVRGILCKNCNSGIARFRDSVVIIDQAIKYIRERV